MIPIGARLAIISTEETDPPPPGRAVVRLVPGVVQGTGWEPWTALTLQMLERAVRPGVGAVLDIGTGTGILALAALALGAERADAVDIDRAALERAAHNATVNVAPLAVHDRQLPDRTYALILHTVAAPDLLIEQLPDLSTRLAPRGHLIAQMPAEAEATVVAAAQLAGLAAPDQGRAATEDGAWVNRIFTKGA